MTVQELIVKMGFQVDESKLRRADNAIGSIASSAAKFAAVGFVAYKAFDGLMSSIKAAANLEGMNAQFEVMLGNADAAKYLTQQINQLAAETPFETIGLVDNVRTMMAFGQSAKESFDAVKMLGDVAGASQEKLSRLSLVYGQTMSAGKLVGNDLLQYIAVGFNPLQTLSQKTGKSMGQLRAEMEKGLITAAMVTEAFTIATSKGGLFYGNMEKQSKTLNGLWSTLTDNIRITMAELGGRFLPVLKEIITYMIPMTESIAGAYRSLADFFAIMFEGGPTALEIAAGISAAFMTIADAIMLVGSVLQGVWSVLQIAFGGLMTYSGAIAAVLTAPMYLLLKLATWVEEKVAALLGKFRILSGVASFLRTAAGVTEQGADLVATPRRMLFDMAGGSFGAAGTSWDKANRLFGMVGTDTQAAPGSTVGLTDKILAALAGSKKVVTNTINNNVTVHGSDPLKEAADSIFGRAFQGQLLAIRAASV